MLKTDLNERQQACLRFLVTKGEPVKLDRFVFPQEESRSVLPKTTIAALFIVRSLIDMGLVRRVGKTEIAYESTDKAKELELI